jgi:hypothetical protein
VSFARTLSGSDFNSQKKSGSDFLLQHGGARVREEKKNFISRCKFVLRDEIEITLCCNIWMSQNPMRQLYQMAA